MKELNRNQTKLMLRQMYFSKAPLCDAIKIFNKILLIIFSIALVGCTQAQSQDTPPPQTIQMPDGFEIVIIDGCEYILHHDSQWGGKSHTESMVHKGNCINHNK